MSTRTPLAAPTVFPVTLDSGIADLAGRRRVKKLNFRGALRLAITPLALLAVSNAAYAAVTVSSSCRGVIGVLDPVNPVNGSAWITTQDDCSSNFDSSPLTGTVSGSAQMILPSPTDIVSDVAYADYSARGDYGNLGVAASSWAAHPSTSPYKTQAVGQASVTVIANDTIAVASSTLAQGTWVTISLAGHIEGAVTGSIIKTPTEYYTNTSATISGRVEILAYSYSGTVLDDHFLFDPCFSLNGPGQCTATNGGFFQSYSDTLNVRVGSTLTFSSRLGASSDSTADALYGGVSYNHEGKSEASAMNSLTTYLTPTTAGVQLIAQSGHDYAAPVPEPAAWGLMLSGLALVGAAARRRKQHESRVSSLN